MTEAVGPEFLQPRVRLDGPVRLAEPDPAWPVRFREQEQLIRGALGDRARVVEHVGSTSVPGLAAKPIIDIVVGVPEPGDEAAYRPDLEAAGYVLHVREPEWREHRFLRSVDLAVQVHVFAAGDAEIDRMLLFRDRLRAWPEERRRYEATKRELAARRWDYVQDYADAKSAVVEAIITRAGGGIDTPWEPPLAGTEVEHLVGALDRLRTTFRWKADGLDSEGLQTRVGRSALTLGSLLKHLAVVEDDIFTAKLRGTSIGEPWTSSWGDGDDWPFTSAAEGDPAQLYALWDGAVGRSRHRLDAALADGGLDQPAHIANEEDVHASLRRLVCDLIEEYGRHTGHADLLREAVDGRVGEDPPPGWRPVSG